MFPKVLYFCNKQIKEFEKKMANYWKELNPEFEIKLYSDDDCKEFLLNNYGKEYIDIYNFLRNGPIKADFWRICILYKYGGYYSDIDNVPLVPLKDFIEYDVDFVTCSSYWDSMKFNFNPNFIACKKNDETLKKCIDWYITRYQNNHPYKYWEYSIQRTFTDTLFLENYEKEDGIYSLNGKKVQIIKECSGKNHYDDHNIYKNVRVFNNRTPEWNCNTHSPNE